MDGHKRSLAKGVSWRLIGTMSTFTLALIFTRNLNISLSISVVEFIAKTLLFYLHERAWNRILWDRKKIPTEQNIQQ